MKEEKMKKKNKKTNNFMFPNKNFKDKYGIVFKRKENEGVLHWKLKNYICGFLKEKGYFDFKEEVDCNDYRIDMICISPDNEKIGIEIGDINIHPATDLKKRLKKSSKCVDKIYWCPFDYQCWNRFADVLMAGEFNGENKNMIDGFMIMGKQIGWGNKYKTDLGHYITSFNFKIMFNRKLIYKAEKEAELNNLYINWECVYNKEQELKNKIIKLRKQLLIHKN